MNQKERPATEVSLSIDERVARVTFRGPKGIQTLSRDTRRQLSEILDQLEKIPDVHIVCFEGTGRTFIAGAEISEFRNLDEDTARQLAREGQEIMTRIDEWPALTIAALNGAAAGGGWELALACNFRIASKSCKLGLPETSLGLLPCWGGTVRMTHGFGAALARQLILTGNLISAEQALEWGLVQEVFDAESFSADVNEWIERLRERSPRAQQEANRVIRKTAQRERQFALGFTDEMRAFVNCVNSGQVEKGVKAFLAKEQPVWEE